MRVVVQRVSEASVSINEKIVGSINNGYMILVGIEKNDTTEDCDWLCKKIASLRVFSDAEGKMNLSINQINGECLVVSQFTLHASTKKGNRPSFIRAGHPDLAIPMYENFIAQLQTLLTSPVKAGKFGADMQVKLTNSGPVTIIMDSKVRE